ncbi:MAG: hypothetical protein M0Z60_03835 [Nitrospiraceae bacterium]|nr:hypothetical protein [Nitrospiraceae bacterium]
MRRSTVFGLFVLLCVCCLAALGVTSEIRVSRFLVQSRDLSGITAALKLTDISFSDDARYTRNPSQADIFSAFQDYPGSIEHFPSGSVTPPPDFSSLGAPITVKRR